MLAYSLGIGIPFLLAAAATDRTLRTSAWARRHSRTVMVSGGVFLVGLGLLQVSGAWTEIVASIQGLVAGYSSPI